MSDDGPVLHRGVGAPAFCRSCKAPIVWALSQTTGKAMPFEADPTGVWTIENGAARYLGRPTELPDPDEAPPPRYTSHFSTCPDAKTWRKK